MIVIRRFANSTGVSTRCGPKPIDWQRPINMGLNQHGPKPIDWQRPINMGLNPRKYLYLRMFCWTRLKSFFFPPPNPSPLSSPPSTPSSPYNLRERTPVNYKEDSDCDADIEDNDE